MNHRPIFFLISVVIFSLLSLTCKDRNCPAELIYHFPVSLFPARDTFNIGDTIWLEMSSPDLMTDKAGNVENTFVNFNFRLGFSVLRVDTTHIQSYTDKYISYYSITGKDSLVPTTSQSIYFIVPEYHNQVYSYKSVMILKSKGSFLFEMGSSNPRSNPIRFKGNCDSRPIAFYCRVNNDADNNLTALINLHHPDLISMRDINLLHDYGSYYFVVR